MLKKARDNGRRKSLVEELHSKQYQGQRFEAGHTSVSSGNTGLIPQYYQHKQQKTAMGKEADDEQVREQVATLLMTLAENLLQQCADEVSPLRKGRSPPASLRACASYVLE